MYTNTFLIADIPVRLESVTPFPDYLCRGYETHREPMLSMTVTQADIERERTLTGDFTNPDRYIEAQAVYRRFCTWAAMRDMVMLHASAVAVDGHAYLFAAPSGTGKSTHARLWKTAFGDRAVIINDDKPILQCTETGIIVHGTPWNGKHNTGCRMSAPVRGICFLSQAAENSIRPVPGPQVLPLLMKQVYIPSGKDESVGAVRSVMAVASRVSVWQLACNISPAAAELAYRTMSEGVQSQ